ncbi:hypothetical protein JKP88DRAFT_273435 [Tribonema minus]|uniref:Uncharacterized protein n=1 Tax=Tribonema minus TaxID=303371 RepID=A0A835YUQ2_9STRA|nr:hypothetical protein JKP88DRAFT_273435 [Tribonema minus]
MDTSTIKESIIASYSLEATGTTLALTGLSSSYDDAMPPELGDYIGQEQWDTAMDRINRQATTVLDSLWNQKANAWLCCPCTLGLSLCIYRSESLDMERGAKVVIGYVNESLAAKGAAAAVRFELRRRCCTTRLLAHAVRIDGSAPSAGGDAEAAASEAAAAALAPEAAPGGTESEEQRTATHVVAVV